MIYAIAGCPVMGNSCFTQSQLSRLTERLRKACRRLIDILSQKGDPSL